MRRKAAGKVIFIHAGWVAPRGRGTSENIRRAYDRAVAKRGRRRAAQQIAGNLRLMARVAQRLHIGLALEPPPPMPFGQLGSLPPLVGDIGEPNVGYCIVSGHAHVASESPAEWIRRAGDRLFETHFHDNHGTRDEHLSPGFGTIDWTEVITALRAVHFAGPVTFETAGWPDSDPVRGYTRAIDWWRTCERISR